MTPIQKKRLEKAAADAEAKAKEAMARLAASKEDEAVVIDLKQSCKDNYHGFWHDDLYPHLGHTDKRGAFIKKNRSSLKILIAHFIKANLRYSTGDRNCYLDNTKLTVQNVINIQHKLIDFLHGDDLKYKEIEDACMSAALDNPYDRVKDYFLSLDPINKETNHLTTTLLDCFGAERTPINQAIFQKFFVSGVARALNPGCYIEGTLILFGPQASAKSFACMTVAPITDTYFGDFIDITNTQKATQTLQGKFLVEFSELASLNPKTVEDIKNWLTRKEDTYVEKYANIPTNVQRQFVCIGTTNAATPLNDVSGNRRFWVVKVGEHINIAKLQEIKDEIWYEAYQLYQKWIQPEYRQKYFPRDPWVLTPKEQELLSISNKDFEVPSSATDWLKQNFGSFKCDKDGFVKYSDIKMAISQIERVSDARLSNLLVLELRCKHKRLSDGAYYQYKTDDKVIDKPIAKTDEEIDQMEKEVEEFKSFKNQKVRVDHE